MPRSQLSGWDWQAGFAELPVRFGPPPAVTRMTAAEAIRTAERHFKADRFLQLLESRALPVTCAAPALGIARTTAWVVLLLGRHRRGGAHHPGDDPLAGMNGGSGVVQAVVADVGGELLLGTVVPVLLSLRPRSQSAPAPDPSER